MLPHKKYTPEDIIRVGWRRRWLIVIPFALGLATVPTVARFVPERYQSETLIMVIPQRVPDSYVKATVTERVEDRLPSISAQILSRSRLERIIEEYGLYSEIRKSAPMEDVVRRMRADITGPTIEGLSRESFRLSYSSSEPEIAQKVTARLASLYLEQNLQDRTFRADSTSQFLERELEDAKQRLMAHEKKLEAFRMRHAGQLPSQLTGNLQVIQNAQQQLQNVGESMNRAKERRLLIEAQLADAKMPLPVAPLGTANAPGTAISAAQELENAKAALERARDRYKAGHPRIGELERSVRQLEQKAEEEAARLAASDAAESKPAPSLAEAERRGRIRSLEAQLEVIDRQLATSQADEQRLETTLAAYKSNVDAVPTRESELVELNRGYDVLKATHDSLLLKREDSKIAANLERGQIGEQFSVIDRASLPARPHNMMRRLQVMAAGPVVGLVLGVLLVGLLEYRDSSFKSEQDVVRALSLPVLAMVPAMATVSERRARRRWTLALDVTAMSLLFGAAALLLFWRLHA